MIEKTKNDQKGRNDRKNDQKGQYDGKKTKRL